MIPEGGNICVIWVDDMIDVFTWRDTFGLRIQTPNLDRFFAEGVRFTNAYATVPLCAPCRAELATGLSPFRTGLVDLNRFWRDVFPPEKAWQYDLRRAGFYNFTTGKVDSNYRPMPEDYRRMLFHEEPEAADKGRRRDVHDYLDRGPGIKGVGHPYDAGEQDDRFYDFWVAQNAIDHVARADPSKRHLIQLGFKHPHYQLVAPDRFYRQYDPAQIVWPTIASPEDYFGPQPGFAVYEAAYIANGQWTPEKAGDAAWREVVRAYFACISHVDHEIGRFLDALRASPLAENTTVIFLSDNGFNLGTHDSFHKMSQWDSAAHVPLGIWHKSLNPREIDLPVSLHNIPKTIMDLAGLPPRPDWISGQSLLPLIADDGTFDTTKSPITCVFGTLSVRPSIPELSQYRYFRYPNGEEHVYDLVNDPGETTNIADESPLQALRNELTKGALDLGLDLRGFENPADGVNAMMAVDGSVVLAGGRADNDYWAYGKDAEKIVEEKDGGTDTLWYMAGPDDYVLHVPANIEKIRIATVVSRQEGQTSEKGASSEGKRLKIVAHPDSPIEFETSERVEIDVTGSSGDDVMIGPKHGSATFYGGAGNDHLIAKAKQANRRHAFYGEAGNDTLEGGPGRDTLDGGTGDDLIIGKTNRNTIIAGHGNDTIHDGEGASTINAGPGQNELHIAAGDHVIETGTGITQIAADAGAKILRLAYGGVTVVTWHPEQRYDLKAWPATPKITRTEHGHRLRCGLSILDLVGSSEMADVAAQILK